MKHRSESTKVRRWALGVSVFASALACVYACSSPDIVFAPSPDAAIESAAPDPAVVSDAGASDAPGDEVEAATREDAAKIEAGGPCIGTNPCDCDNDGYLAIRGDCPGGNDCDDYDGLRHPGQTFVSEPPEQGKDGNWDCSPDGTVETQYPRLGCGLLGGSGFGFLTDPGCGQVGVYFQCTGLLGSFVDAGVRRQGCK